MTRPYIWRGALVASGILFVVLARLDFRVGPPPSNGAEILLWRDSQGLGPSTRQTRHPRLLSLGDRACSDARLRVVFCRMVRGSGLATVENVRQCRPGPGEPADAMDWTAWSPRETPV